MSSDLSIPHIRPTAEAGHARAGPPADRPPEGGAAPAASHGKALPNPTLRLDPGLAIVVIEFRDDAGTVRNSIPTEQQLEAYRSWDRGHIGAPDPPPPPVKASETDAKG